MFEADGWSCADCRREADEAEGQPPCETGGGVLEDGLCQWGFPPEFPEQFVLAWDLWEDVQRFGWQFCQDMNHEELNVLEHDALVLGMREIQDAFNRDQRRRMKKNENTE